MSMTIFLRLIEATREVDPVAHAWLKAGLQRYREGELLDRALDLAGAGADCAAEAALFKAADLLDPTHTLPRHTVARLLEAAIRRFARTWPAVRFAHNPNLDSLNRALWEAHVCSGKFPRHRRRLDDLLTRRIVTRQSILGDAGTTQQEEVPREHDTPMAR